MPGRAGSGSRSFGALPPRVRSLGSPLCGALGAAGCREDLGVRGTLGVLPKHRGNFPACPAPQRREPGLAGSDPLPPLRLRSEDGFTPISPSMFPLSFARRADYYNSSVIHIPILTASRGPWRHGPPLSPPSPSLLSCRTPPSRRRR